MRASWHALHASLIRSSTTLSFQHRFNALRDADLALSRFPDSAALLDWLHAPEGDASDRNQALQSLVRAAQGEVPDTAVTLLLLALWPGLDAVRRRLARFYRDEPDALTSEVSARIVANIRKLHLTRVSWIAATLLKNVEREIRRSLRAQWALSTNSDPWTEDAIARHSGPASALAVPEGLDADRAAALIADRLRSGIGGDAELVVQIAVQGARQNEAAERLGLSPAAARKRYQRALGRLRIEFGAAA